MIAPRLSPVRRIEAKRLLAHLVASKKKFDAEEWVEKLAAVMIDTPEVVKTAAAHLRAWNTAGDEGDPDCTHRFTMRNCGHDGYNVIAEVVLDAAALYRGETIESVEPDEYSNTETTDLLPYKQVIQILAYTQKFLQAVADGRHSPKRAEAHASHLSQVIRTLQAQHHE